MRTIYDHVSPATLPVNLEFDDVSLKRISMLLLNRYGVSIVLSEEKLGDVRFTGNFHSGVPWEQIVQHLASELSVNCKIVTVRSFELSVME